ncbi:hypothetical protein EfmAA242_09640 [Enterococcus faecium]|nr:hypothetical protein EfmAA242_09640 [Enterococcus faecium]
MRNIFDKLPKKVSSDVKDELKSIFKASELELTRERKEHFLEKYGCDSKLSAACDILENGFEDAIQILSFPYSKSFQYKQVWSTNQMKEE